MSKTVCLGGSLSIWRPFVAVLGWLGKAPPVRFVRVAELEATIADAGFEVVETLPFSSSPPARPRSPQNPLRRSRAMPST